MKADTQRFPVYPAYKDSGVEWLGQVPEHWSMKRLKFIAIVQTGIAKGKDYGERKTLEVPYLRVANVQDGYLSLEELALIEIPVEDLPRYLLRPGDVLMNEGGDYDKLGRGHIWNGEIDPCVHQNHVFSVRPHGVTSTWLNLATGSSYAQFYFMSKSKQSTNLASISSSNIMELPVPLPPPPEQHTIAAFLDHETARIDRLIAKQEELIALLKEKRQAVISHAVTKGLNPDAKMKDSGVEWLGQVPEHWKISQLRYEIKSGTSITYGIVQAGPDYEDGIPYIRTGDMIGNELPENGYLRTAPEIDRAYQRSKVYFGDIVVAIRATVGKCLPLPQHLDGANLTQGTAKISPGKSAMRDYLLGYLNSANSEQRFHALAKGATFKEITLEMLRMIPLPIPPIEEQRAIVELIDQTTLIHRKLLDEATNAIALLQERRSALISAAVTGKIDVRDWKPE